MPGLISKVLPTINGVAANSTADVEVPLGLTVHGVMFNIQESGVDSTLASMRTNLTAVRALIDGVVRMNVPGDDLIDVMNGYYGRPREDGKVFFPLARQQMRTPDGEDFGALPTADNRGNKLIQSLTFELDLGGFTAPTVSAVALLGPPKDPALGQNVNRIIALRRHTISVGATGEVELSDVPKGKNRGMLAAHLDTNAVNRVRVEADTRRIFDMNKAEADHWYQRHNDKAPNANYFHVDFAARNRLSDMQNLDLQDFRFVFDFTSTGNFGLLTETVEQL